MRCPACTHAEDKVVDSRATREGQAIRRRRECLNCGHRFTTYEYIENAPLLVIKKNGETEPFDRQKLLLGVEKACWKRSVKREDIGALVDAVQEELEREFAGEVSTRTIGERVMARLVELDEVAYVRFASVYRHFRDVNQFMAELKRMLERDGDRSAASGETGAEDRSPGAGELASGGAEPEPGEAT